MTLTMCTFAMLEFLVHQSVSDVSSVAFSEMWQYNIA